MAGERRTNYVDTHFNLIKDFLLPVDTVTRRFTLSRFAGKPRADYTCEWFSRHLTDFTRSDNGALLVTGKPASGKTILAEWVVERLQSLSGRRASDVIAFIIGEFDNSKLSRQY